MKIIYYITNDVKLIIELLERELCIRQISYVRVDNEIHFLDKIVRIIDINTVRIIDINEKKQMVKLDCNYYDKFLDIDDDFDCSDNIINVKNKRYQKKKDFKRDSHNVNAALKRTIR